MKTKSTPAHAWVKIFSKYDYLSYSYIRKVFMIYKIGYTKEDYQTCNFINQNIKILVE